jgi:hypothetical protein
MALGKSLSDIDNKFTYVVGYRNTYNIAVLFIAAMAYLLYPAAMIAVIILVVLGLKWFLTQVRENLDVVYINEMAAKEIKTNGK